jgi:hypothetical protein
MIRPSSGRYFASYETQVTVYSRLAGQRNGTLNWSSTSVRHARLCQQRAVAPPSIARQTQLAFERR